MVRAVVIAILSVVAFAVIFNGERAISMTTPAVILGDEAYSYGKLKAPVASGAMLTAQAWVLTRSPFGPFLCRFLLGTNGIHTLRELGSQIPTTPPLHQPMRLLSPEDHAAHADAAVAGQQALDAALSSSGAAAAFGAAGTLPPLAEASRAGEYFRAFAAGLTTPSEVAARTLDVIVGGLQTKCVPRGRKKQE